MLCRYEANAPHVSDVDPPLCWSGALASTTQSEGLHATNLNAANLGPFP